MPPIEQSYRRQKAVAWYATGASDAYGQPTVSAVGVELDVRWNDKASEALDPRGNTVRVDATVVTAVDIPIGSRMWLGKLADFDAAAANRIMQVLTNNATPDLKARVYRRTVGLMRLRDGDATGAG